MATSLVDRIGDLVCLGALLLGYAWWVVKVFEWYAWLVDYLDREE